MDIFSDIDLELVRQNDGDINKNVDIDAVKNSLKNIINTLTGSRRMLPPFATNSHGVLFEQLDSITLQNLGELILGGIETWEPRVIVESINVRPNYDQNRVDFELVFYINEFDNQEIYSFTFSRGNQ